MTRRIRTYNDIAERGTGSVPDQVVAQHERLQRRLASVRYIVAVGSGKGGVGKSLVAAQLASALARRGHRVGALDADLHGPSLASMLGAVPGPLRVDDEGVHPARTAAGCSVMSTELLLATPDTPLRWRGPGEAGFIWQSTLDTGALRELLADTVWGTLDYLVIDLPPGTDRLARLDALIPAPSALLLVTTPARAATGVVARSIAHAREAGAGRVALISNMDGFVCGACGAPTSLFPEEGGRALAARMGVELWATIPFDPALGRATDAGEPGSVYDGGSAAAGALDELAERVARELPVPVEAEP